MSIFTKKQNPAAPAKAAPQISGAGASTVLKHPLISERATDLVASNQYVFIVEPNATKPSVRDEIQRRYGVRVLRVNILNGKGKVKRYGYKLTRRNGLRKAFVTLKAGDKIEIQ